MTTSLITTRLDQSSDQSSASDGSRPVEQREKKKNIPMIRRTELEKSEKKNDEDRNLKNKNIL
mgnify:CR=1 FL=1